jgi:hypothetical protein
MLDLAFERAPTSSEGLQRLVKFYAGAGDPTALRARLDRIAEAMRAQIALDPKDGAAYRTIARAVGARITGPSDRSLAIVRAGAELAELLGAGAESERRFLAEPPHGDASWLAARGADEVLFAGAAQPAVRQLFRAAGNAIAKHVGVQVAAHGVGRKDRLHATAPAAAIAREVAAGLGLKDVDVYVSTRDPYAMVAEPTSPVSLVLGAAIAAGDATRIRFAAGGALVLALGPLAIPARLRAEELGVIGYALLRMFQPDIACPGVRIDEVNAALPKLRRLIPAHLGEELRPIARTVASFSPRDLARDLKIAGLRAGLVASGSVVPGLWIIASAGGDSAGVLFDPLAQGLIAFALSERDASRR